MTWRWSGYAVLRRASPQGGRRCPAWLRCRLTGDGDGRRAGGISPRLVEESALGPVLDQQQLEQSGVPLEKRSLATGEIQVPHADEASVEPERAHAIAVPIE